MKDILDRVAGSMALEGFELTEDDRRRIQQLVEHPELKQLYRMAKEIQIDEALQLIREAESEEEKSFYAFVLNQHFQRKQAVAIEQNLF